MIWPFPDKANRVIRKQSQEKNYSFLLEVQQHALSLLKDGAVVKEVVTNTIEFIKSSKPELEQYFQKSLGSRVRFFPTKRAQGRSIANFFIFFSQTGLEFRDTTCLLNGKNGKLIREGMVLNLQVAFQGLPDPKNKGQTYACLLSLLCVLRGL